MQAKNMLLISVTFDTSKPDTSRLVRPSQPQNIDLMSVTFDVSKP